MKTYSIGEAKYKTYKANPFIGSILFNLPVEETEEIQTMGVDGSTLFVNPKFWETLENGERLAVIFHEAGHLFLEHIYRSKNYPEILVDNQGNQVKAFNIAGDYVINLLIADDQSALFNLPKSCLLNMKYRNWSTENVYADIIKNTKNGKISQASMCDKGKWETSQNNKAQQNKWASVIKNAAEHARQRGFMPAYLERYFKEIEPKEDWRILLREYAQPFRNDYSFSPADRRYDEFIIPDVQDGEMIDWVGIAIDTSGSIDDKEINSFLSEVKGIMSAFDKVRVKITFCDAEASPFVELDEWDSKKLKITGGGGTDFRPAFELVNKEESAPLCFIYFTDMYGEFPNKQPAFDTMWISTSRDMKAPFGKTLFYK